jgi:hypothetical protein
LPLARLFFGSRSAPSRAAAAFADEDKLGASARSIINADLRRAAWNEKRQLGRILADDNQQSEKWPCLFVHEATLLSGFWWLYPPSLLQYFHPSLGLTSHLRDRNFEGASGILCERLMRRIREGAGFAYLSGK